MKPLVRLAEQILVVVSLLYLTESLFGVLPGALFSPIQYGMYGVTFLLLAARWRRSLAYLMRDPLLVVMLGLTIFSFLWSDFPKFSLRNSIVACQTASVGIYMASCYSVKQQLKLIGWAMGIAAFLSISYAVLLPSVGVHLSDSHAGAWRGIYSHKNILSQVATYSSLAFLILTLCVKRYRYIPLVGFGMSVMLLLMSTSKTGLMVFLTLLLLLQIYRASRWRRTKSVLVLMIILMIFSGTIVVLIGSAEAILTGLGRDLTLTGRTGIWAYAVEQVKRRPLLGYGRGAFWHPDSSVAVKVEDGLGGVYLPPHSHNGFVDLMCDLGLIGLSIFIINLIITFLRTYNYARVSSDAEKLWPVIYLSFFLLYNITESSIMKHNSAFWATYVAASLSVSQLHRSKSRDASSIAEIPEQSQLIIRTESR
ncbi:MAG: O-antigen ligase family protein [Microcoleaceae cyanobacterium]